MARKFVLNLCSMPTLCSPTVLLPMLTSCKLPCLSLAAEKMQGIIHVLGAISEFFLQSLLCFNFCGTATFYQRSHLLTFRICLKLLKKTQGVSHMLGVTSKFVLQSFFYFNFLRHYCVIIKSHTF